MIINQPSESKYPSSLLLPTYKYTTSLIIHTAFICPRSTDCGSAVRFGRALPGFPVTAHQPYAFSTAWGDKQHGGYTNKQTNKQTSLGGTGGASNIVKAESSQEDLRVPGGLFSNLPHPRVNETKQHTAHHSYAFSTACGG